MADNNDGGGGGARWLTPLLPPVRHPHPRVVQGLPFVEIEEPVGFHGIDGSRTDRHPDIGSTDAVDASFHFIEERTFTMNLIILIVVLVLLFGGGGGYYYSRRNRG